jgi:hypothetical protein
VTAAWVMAGLMALLSLGFALYAAQCQAQRDKALAEAAALELGVRMQAVSIASLRSRLGLAMAWGAHLVSQLPVTKSRRCPGSTTGDEHDFQPSLGGHCGRCGWGHK